MARMTLVSGGRAGGRARKPSGKKRSWQAVPETTTYKNKNFKKNTGMKSRRKRAPLIYVPIDKALNNTATEYYQDPPKNYVDVATDVGKMGKPIKVGTRGSNKSGRGGHKAYTTFENITATNSSGFSTRRRPIPARTTNETSSGGSSSGANAMGARDHRTVLDTGHPLTRALRSVKKQNGTKKQVLYDTKVDSVVVGSSPVPRSALNHSCGFNSTNLWMLPSAISVTARRLGSVVDGTALNDNAPADSKERVLLSTEYFQSELRLHNQSSFLPIKLKFIIIAHDNDANESILPEACLLNAFNGTPLTSQKFGAIPNAYQHSNPVGEGSGSNVASSIHVDYSNKSRGLMDSPWFRAKHKIAKTISKTLGPGETWYIKHRHHTGSGIDYYSLLQDARDSDIQSDKPLGYSYAVESCGVPCEALHRTDPGGVLESYLGTSSGWYTSEFKCTLKFILADTRASSELQSVGAQMEMHARVYNVNDDITAEKQEFHKLPDDITQNADVPNGKVYIPVVTDMRVRSHDSKTGAGDDQ